MISTSTAKAPTAIATALAGATEVAIVSGRRWALMHELRGEDEPKLDDILARLAPCDLVLVEGYKREGHPKIETRRLAAKDTAPLTPDDPQIRAIASDHPVDGETVPVFAIDDVAAIADFIAGATGLSAADATCTIVLLPTAVLRLIFARETVGVSRSAAGGERRPTPRGRQQSTGSAENLNREEYHA